VEFIISTQILDNYINSNDSILDVASGTGIYSFYYAKRGHNNVFSTDITPKHIQAIKNKLSGKSLFIKIHALIHNTAM
jgi:ribosomal protein L11 methylase PrmA